VTGENRALCRHRIEVRRVEGGQPGSGACVLLENPEVTIAEVIGQDEDNVRLGLRGERRSKAAGQGEVLDEEIGFHGSFEANPEET